MSRSEREELLQILEEQRRRAARRGLIEYSKFIEIPGAPVTDDEGCETFYADKVAPAKHHLLIMQALQEVAEGRMKRLMIFMPPGSAKSTYASVVFPTWFMGWKPNSNLIMATYGGDLAKKFGRKCRQIAKSKEYKDLFKATLSGDNAAVDDWSLSNGSTYMCGGILSGITGNRADGLIIDDPVKGREDADSETVRNKMWDEYKDSCITRLKPNGWQIIINTRWNEDDICGRILPDRYDGGTGWFKGKDGSDWYVLSLQAQCEFDNDPLGREIGEYLWPEWFPLEWWEQTKRTQSTPTPRSWNSLYQQRPAPDEGNYFRREWLRWYEERPQHLRMYGTSDYAVTDGGGDYTVHAVWGVDPDDNLYLIYLWRGRTDSMVWVEILMELIKQFQPSQWGEEQGQIIKSVGSLIDKRQRETGAYCYRKQFASTSDKASRAQAFRGRMAMGKVYLPKQAAWLDDFLHEMMVFPAGTHDDQVDVCSLIGRMLAEMHAADTPPPSERAVIDALNAPVTIQERFNQHLKRRQKGE